jgi:hypothetical protein
VPPSESDEAAWVFLTSMLVFVGVLYVVAFQLDIGSDAGRPRRDQMLAFQVLFRDLPGPEQRVYREMKEGLDEALRLRGTQGTWPSVAELAEAGIPPFAPDVLDRSSLLWEQRREELVNEYIGTPSRDTGVPLFLILVQEPAPGSGEDPSAAGVDEEHQLLPDGRLLHVTYWKHPLQPLGSGLIADPPLQGWQQIRVASPFLNTIR